MADTKDVVRCGACKKDISRNKFGSHIVSSSKTADGETHLAYFLRHNSEQLKKIYQQHIVEGKKLTSSSTFYKFKIGRDDYHICLGCKKAYVNDCLHLSSKKCCEAYLGWVGHHLSPEKSKDDRIKELEALLAQSYQGKVGEVSGVALKPSTAHIERIEELEKENAEKDEEIETKEVEIFKYRGLLRTLLGDKFPAKLSSPTYFEELEEAVQSLVAPAPEPAPEPPKPEPPKPKFNEARVAAFVAAHIARDWDAQGKAAKSMSDEDTAEASRRINEYEAKPKPKPALVAAPNPPPASSSAFQPPPVNPPVLTSTRTRIPGKQLYREKQALLQTN